MGATRVTENACPCDDRSMTDLLEQAVETVRELAPHQQDRISRVMIAASENEPYELTAEENAWLAPRIAAADRGDFASDDEVRATFARHGVEYDGNPNNER